MKQITTQDELEADITAVNRQILTGEFQLIWLGPALGNGYQIHWCPNRAKPTILYEASALEEIIDLWRS